MVTREGKVEVRKVTVGMETADYAEIRSGISEGELVAIGNRSQLTPGEIVTPKVTQMAAGKE